MSTTSAEGILTSSTILPALGVIAVSLRFHVRSKQKGSLGADDWLQIPALLLFIGMAIAAIYGASQKAFGYPTPSIPPTEPPSTLILSEKLWFIIQSMQIVALGIIKIAALLFYKRIFVTRNNILNKLIWLLIVIVAVWSVGFFSYYIGACGTHPEAAWSGYIEFAQYCLKTEYFEQAFGISDFMLDTMVLVVPLPSIWRLHTSLRRKLGIMGVFLLALIGYAASLARLVTFVLLANSSLSTALPDIQSQDTQAIWFSNIETGLSLIALNLPSIWSLFSRLSVQSRVQTVRSAFSLNSQASYRSFRTHNKAGSYNELPDSRTPRGPSSHNVELMPRSQEGHFETISTPSVDAKGDGIGSSPLGTPPMKGAIRVDRSVDLIERRV